MKKPLETSMLLAVLALYPSSALPHPDEELADLGDADASLTADPPQARPPPPPETLPSPPPQKPPPPAQPPSGQWVYTAQYGWVWMPHADAYTYVPPGGYGEPYAYVYGPSFGWTWVVAPWIWGWGPWPSFGVVGPRHYGWYGHGWWRDPGRWHFAPRPGGGHRFPGVRPAPHRGAWVGPGRSVGGRGFVGHRGGRHR